MRISEKPLRARISSTRLASAKAKGPGARGSGGGCSGKNGLAASSGADAQGFSGGVRQQTKAMRPPGLSALRMLAKAGAGASKNITPKREKIRSNSGMKG